MKQLAWVCALLLAGGAQHAPGADWSMEPSGSSLEFIATYEQAAAPGVFREFDTQLRFDPDQLAESRIDVTIKVTSADMRSTEINDAIKGPSWFDFARFAQAEFHATDIRRAEDNRFLARGVLSVKGIQQPVEVPFVWAESGNAATMEGELIVDRGIFGIGTGEWAATNVISADVTVKFRVRLRKTG